MAISFIKQIPGIDNLHWCILVCVCYLKQKLLTFQWGCVFTPVEIQLEIFKTFDVNPMNLATKNLFAEKCAINLIIAYFICGNQRPILVLEPRYSSITSPLFVIPNALVAFWTLLFSNRAERLNSISIIESFCELFWCTYAFCIKVRRLFRYYIVVFLKNVVDKFIHFCSRWVGIMKM
jgi:hypothetical protein